MAIRDDDYADSPDNIFADDYMSDGLFGEEDEEVGSDFHEIDFTNDKRAAAEAKAFKKEREIGDIPKEQRPKVKGKLPPKMRSKGIEKAILVFPDKIVVLLP